MEKKKGERSICGKKRNQINHCVIRAAACEKQTTSSSSMSPACSACKHAPIRERWEGLDIRSAV